MNIMSSKFNQLIQLFNEKLKIILSISFGIFLFILFFQPFTIERFDFNDRLLFIAGFGVIVFLSMFLVRIVLPWVLKKRNLAGEDPVLNSYMEGLLILVLCSVAFTFYLRYVGSINIYFYTVFKVTLISFVPLVILKIYDDYKMLVRLNESLASERNLIQNQIEKYEEEILNKSIDFTSETGSESISLTVAELVFVQSADNYVEIVFSEGGIIRKKVIRSTLKNTENLLKQYPNFMRVHRTCIVNLHHIEKLHHGAGSHWITLKGFEEKIPVSRQYLLKLKEALLP